MEKTPQFYKPGDYWCICPVTGLKIRASKMRFRWDGEFVSKEAWEMRHPQEFVRPKADKQSVPVARPEQTDVFLEGTQTTYLSYISQESDDCIRYDSQFSTTGQGILGTYYWNQNAFSTICGCRFSNVVIPSGSSITAAYITFNSWTTRSTNYVNLNIFGEISANSSTFSTYADFMDRFTSKTTHSSVPWLALPAWGSNTTYDTPDLTGIVNEIIGIPEWRSGNPLAFFIDGRASTWDINNQRIATGYSVSPAKLTIIVTNNLIDPSSLP